MNLVDTIKSTLIEANDELQGARIISFWFDTDSDISDKDGLVVNVVYVISEPKSAEESWEIDVQDGYCERVAPKLSDYVAYTNCWYRSESEYKASDFNKNRRIYELAS